MTRPWQTLHSQTEILCDDGEPQTENSEVRIWTANFPLYSDRSWSKIRAICENREFQDHPILASPWYQLVKLLVHVSGVQYAFEWEQDDVYASNLCRQFASAFKSVSATTVRCKTSVRRSNVCQSVERSNLPNGMSPLHPELFTHSFKRAIVTNNIPLVSDDQPSMHRELSNAGS